MYSSSVTIKSKLVSWLQYHRANKEMNVKAIPFGVCKEWSFSEGALTHKTGRFFRIVGCKVYGNFAPLNGLEQPMIDQPEIGILGFTVRKTDSGWEWFVQAKAEPGNVGGFQGAPSVQATKSNYEVVHNGLPTPMIECFTGSTPDSVTISTNIQQSEQGDRFINKFNRNCVAVIPSDYPTPKSDLYRWFSASDIRKGLISNYTLNTDARSVLFCSDWGMLCNPETTPFSRWRDENNFGQKLFYSINSDKSQRLLDDCFEKINSIRNSTEIHLDYLSLNELKGWTLKEDSLESVDGSASFLVKFYSAYIKSREVDHWCQPLIESKKKVIMALLCTTIDDILHFFLRFSPEPGFRNKVQLGPSLVDDTNHLLIQWCKKAIDEKNSVKHISVLQSDEGGRFMNSVVDYQIYEIDPKWVNESGETGVWLTLRQLKELVTVKGYLNNEARSILSILLSWV